MKDELGRDLRDVVQRLPGVAAEDRRQILRGLRRAEEASVEREVVFAIGGALAGVLAGAIIARIVDALAGEDAVATRT